MKQLIGATELQLTDGSFMPVDSYKVISLIYNDLVRHVNYKEWGNYLTKLIKLHSINAENVLEIAAGTGNLSKMLQLPENKLFVITDLSYNMINQAPANIPKICADMTKLSFKSSFDLIFSTFDSVNHLPNEDELKQHFREVHRVLKPGGYYFFDVVTEKNSEMYLKGFSRNRRKGIVVYSQESEYNKELSTHFNRFKIAENDQEFEIQEQKEFIFPEELIENILHGQSFTIYGKYDAFSLNPVDNLTLRIQYVIRRGK
ncbi:MAG: Ubiquinone/menaquinone biosynthesis C-methyltransferase UbiE [Ignavibacteriaceae bacterium]|nr:Ubiquinone/menaquinone biosynthesis C-methyltransferase UbiE [Ignavibacteriaceae bacterium]